MNIAGRPGALVSTSTSPMERWFATSRARVDAFHGIRVSNTESRLRRRACRSRGSVRRHGAPHRRRSGAGLLLLTQCRKPGVWDIHSPRVPTSDEVDRLLQHALAALPPERLRVNPDCGLKTRAWPEVEA